MQTVDIKTIVIAALVAVVIVLLGRDSGPQAHAAPGLTDSNSDMIAVTGEYGNGTSVLYVIDTKAKQMAVYRAPRGDTVEFVGARQIEWDLKLTSHNDVTAEGYHPFKLKKKYEEYIEKRGGRPGDPTPPAKPAGGDGEKK